MEIHRHDMDIKWVTEFNGIPTKGLGKVNGKWCEFTSVFLPEYQEYSDNYVYRTLTLKECIMWLFRWKINEPVRALWQKIKNQVS